MGKPKGPNDLGIAIRRLRGNRTQAKLAERAGLRNSAWSDYERGKRNPRPEQMERIASAIGCTLIELEQAALKQAATRLAAGQPEEPASEPAETSDSLIEEMDRELHEIDQHLDHLLARKRRLLSFRRHLVGLPPGTPMPGGP